MSSLDQITYRRFEPTELDAVRLLTYQSEDIIEGDEDLIVAVNDKEIIAVAGAKVLSETEAELKPLLLKSGQYEIPIIENLLLIIEKLAKANARAILIINCLRADEKRQELYEKHGYRADEKSISGRAKFIEYRKDLNYFRQHDLGL